MRNNTLLSEIIFDQDFGLLKHLVDVRCIIEENSEDFTLEFHFSENSFMRNEVLTKKYIMGPNDDPKGEGTEIHWKCNSLTQGGNKLKKTGKNKKAITDIEEIPSFFLFFKTDPDNIDYEVEEEGKKMEDTLECDYETACELRDELIPNAVYYYLGAIESKEHDNNADIYPKIQNPYPSLTKDSE